MRYPDKVERWPGRISDVRHPGGVSDDFRPGGMSYATRRKGDVCMSKREEATWHFLRRIPQCPLFISPVWPGQKRWDKNAISTKFFFHMGNNGTWRFLVMGASEVHLGSSSNAPACK